MFDLWMKIPDAGRAAIAAVICLALFTSDIVTSVDLNESQLYPVVMMLLYRVRSKQLLWGVMILASFLAWAGYIIDPPENIWDGVTNRVFSAITIIAVAYGVQ